MQQELSDRLSAYDQTVSSDATKLKRWLNMGQNYICGKYLWPFMLAEETIQTVTDYTTGTVATVAGSTSITFSATISTSKTNFYIKFSDSNDWYQITAHTAGSASATITPAAINTNTVATLTIRKLLYTTTTPLASILDMKQLTTPAQVISTSPRDADYFLPLYYSAGTVYNYIMSTPSSTGTAQFSFMYSPSATINVMVRGIKALSDLSSDSDTTIIPTQWHDAMVAIGAWYGFQSLDDTRAVNELQYGENRIEDMKRNFSYDLGRHRVMRPSAVGSSSWLQWTLPSSFGPSVGDE